MARTKTPRNGDAGNKPVASTTSTSQIALVPEVKKNSAAVDIEAEIRRRISRRRLSLRIGALPEPECSEADHC